MEALNHYEYRPASKDLSKRAWKIWPTGKALAEHRAQLESAVARTRNAINEMRRAVAESNLPSERKAEIKRLIDHDEELIRQLTVELTPPGA